MNKAETGSNGRAGDPMANDVNRREQLSALADGQLQGEELAAALAFAAEDEEGGQAWQLYHLVGDVLRSPDLAQPANSAFMSRLREQMAQEAPPERPRVPARVEVVAAQLPEAANASVFRWKMLAGLASMAAVAAIGWTSLASLQGAGPSGAGAQLAAAPERSVVQAAPVIAVADAEGSQVMLRDPRLDELLAAHKQFGSTSALQMPAGFLRNATFETPGR